MTLKTDARGVRTYYRFHDDVTGVQDPLNRINAVLYDNSGPLEPGLNIAVASNVFYEYMTTGDKSRIKKIITQGILTEDFAYDVESRVIENKQTVDYRPSYPMTTNYLYDTLDRVKEVTYPAQCGLAGNPRKIVAHTYDEASRLTGMTYGTVITPVQQAGDIVYNASDQTTSIKIGTAGTNQVTENYTFDQQTGLLTNQKAIRNGSNLLDLSYEYNRGGSVGSLNGKTGHQTKIINNLDTNKNREYEFDAVGRLTAAWGGPNKSLSVQSYAFDRYGNRTSVYVNGIAADGSLMPRDGIANLTYSTANNRITTAGFEYDVAGNQTRALAEDGVTWVKYEYDSANRLRLVKKDDGPQTPLQSFLYGSTNARLMSLDHLTNQWTLYASNGGTTLSEYTEFTLNVPTWTKSYTYLGGSQLSTITPNGSGGEYTEYNHPDRLGTRVITNQAGGTNYEQAHLPFGTALNAESSGSSNTRFTSYDRSVKTGLDYAINRTYDSKQGRFTQVDPIGMSAFSHASPQTLNMYTYCGNDPINYTDPNGLFWGSLFRWIGKIFKWIMLAVTIAVAILTVVGTFMTPIAFAAFMKTAVGQVLGFIAGIPGIVGKFISGLPKLVSGIFTFISQQRAAALIGWGVLAAGSSIGSIANHIDGTKKKKAKGSSNKSRICHWLQTEMGRFGEFFDRLWDKTKTTGKEAGGYIGVVGSGEVVPGVGEPLVKEIYTGTKGVTKNAMGTDFTLWLRQQNNSAANTTAAISVHTHPRGTLKPSGTSNPNAVGGISGDYGTVVYAGLNGAIVTSSKVVIYDANRIICTIDR